jgi:hypothetical protein
MQNDWGVNVRNLITSSKKWVSHIMFLALMHTNKMVLLNKNIVT